jgi:hypothetical protein
LFLLLGDSGRGAFHPMPFGGPPLPTYLGRTPEPSSCVAPEDGCRCRMSSDAPVTRPGPEPNPRAFLCFLQSETAQLAAYAVFPVHRRQSRRQACRAAAAALPAARASPLADRTLQARQQIWSGSDQIGFHRGTQEHPSSDQSKVQGLPGSKSGPAGFRHAGIDGKALALTSPGVMHAATTRSKM